MTNTDIVSLFARTPDNPLFWVDLDEHIALSEVQDYQSKIGWLFLLFDDPTVERIEAAVFVHGYIQAANGNGARELTYRQELAIRYRSEALRKGRTDIHEYVARKLHIARHTATELLQRADVRLEAKIRHNNELFQIDNRADITPFPERVIKAKMKSLPRECAGGRGIESCKGTCPGDRPICWPCRMEYGIRGEWPDWLTYRARDIEREHRQMAIDALYATLGEPSVSPPVAMAKIA